MLSTAFGPKDSMPPSLHLDLKLSKSESVGHLDQIAQKSDGIDP